jgi:G:T-mismatch repair DNA endonuclease (very short patch repair protein)
MIKGSKHSEISLVKMKLAHQGVQTWNKGMKMSDDFVETNRRVHTGLKLSEETKHKMSIVHLGNKSCTGMKLSEETKHKMSEAHKKSWSNQEHKDYHIKQIFTHMHMKPNIPETKLMSILNGLYPNEYEYTGDGKVILNGCNPDFTNINGRKKIIEMFGDYWHRGENPHERVDKFAELGFDCLIIWESELKRIDKVIVKIKKFHNK